MGTSSEVAPLLRAIVDDPLNMSRRLDAGAYLLGSGDARGLLLHIVPQLLSQIPETKSPEEVLRHCRPEDKIEMPLICRRPTSLGASGLCRLVGVARIWDALLRFKSLEKSAEWQRRMPLSVLYARLARVELYDCYLISPGDRDADSWPWRNPWHNQPPLYSGYRSLGEWYADKSTEYAVWLARAGSGSRLKNILEAMEGFELQFPSGGMRQSRWRSVLLLKLFQHSRAVFGWLDYTSCNYLWMSMATPKGTPIKRDQVYFSLSS